jgi:hypothetical protein
MGVNLLFTLAIILYSTNIKKSIEKERLFPAGFLFYLRKQVLSDMILYWQGIKIKRMTGMK